MGVESFLFHCASVSLVALTRQLAQCNCVFLRYLLFCLCMCVCVCVIISCSFSLMVVLIDVLIAVLLALTALRTNTTEDL